MSNTYGKDVGLAWFFSNFGSIHALWSSFQLLLWKVVPAAIGFLAFVGKLSVTLTQVQNLDSPGNPHWRRVVVTTILMAGLMNQLMFVVDGNKLARRAILQFMFAGADGTMQREEWDRQEVFMACLFRRIFDEFKERPLQRMVAIVTFSTKDLQCMVLEEDDSLKASPEAIKLAKRLFGRKLTRQVSTDGISRHRSSIKKLYDSADDGDAEVLLARLAVAEQEVEELKSKLQARGLTN